MILNLNKSFKKKANVCIGVLFIFELKRVYHCQSSGHSPSFRGQTNTNQNIVRNKTAYILGLVLSKWTY